MRRAHHLEPKRLAGDRGAVSTSQLDLQLLTTTRRELSPDAWLQFDGKNQEFVGIPLAEEQSLKSRGIEYKNYIKTTNMFFPGPPKDLS